MKRIEHLAVISLLGLASTTPAFAQEVDRTAATAQQQATSPPPEAIATPPMQEQLLRQQLIASNARGEVERLRQQIKLKDELLVLGRERNAELYAVASEILARLAKHDGIDPFIQARRVQMENLVQSYEDKLRAARIYENTLPPSVEKRMQQELGAQPDANQ